MASVTDLDVAVPGDLSLDFTPDLSRADRARDALGPLGYGWTDDWQYSLSVGSDGTVTVTMPSGDQRIFQPDSRGSDYFDEPGDNGILTEGTGGTFTLQESNGQIEAFNANGTLNFIQDTDGNRITAGYTGSRLTSLTDSSGPSLTLAYNAAGLISSVTSSTGQTVDYTYDSGEHLIDVTSFDGQADAVHIRGRVQRGDAKRAGVDHKRRWHVPEFHVQCHGPVDRHIANRRR